MKINRDQTCSDRNGHLSVSTAQSGTTLDWTRGQGTGAAEAGILSTISVICRSVIFRFGDILRSLTSSSSCETLECRAAASRSHPNNLLHDNRPALIMNHPADRRAGRQTDRQTDRQAGKQTDKQESGRQACRQTGRRTDRQASMQAGGRQAGRQTDRQADRQTNRQTSRQAARCVGRRALPPISYSDTSLEKMIIQSF